ncbi:MAG: hypothetical protein ACE5KZ_04740 [Candidatus Scalinduaceae bacterium]
MAETKLIVDGHVHFYSCYDPDKFFDAAMKNMDTMFHAIYPNGDKFTKILLFSEGKQNDYFSQFKKKAIVGQKSDYLFETTSEDCSLILKKITRRFAISWQEGRLLPKKILKCYQSHQIKKLKIDSQSKMMSRGFLINKQLRCSLGSWQTVF